MEELAAFDHDRSVLWPGGTEAAAGRTGLFGRQVLGLLLRGLFEGAGSKPRSGGSS